MEHRNNFLLGQCRIRRDIAVNRRAVVLWTGGKDCHLALHEAREQGFEIVSLMTFTMEGHASFRAHPLPFMTMQSKAIGIPHEIVPVREPYQEGYEHAIAEIKRKFDISTLVTGDIAEVLNNSHWITDRSKPSGVRVFLPLWHLERRQLLQKAIALRYKIIFSCVKAPWLTIDWLGKELDLTALEKLESLHKINGIDICGEQGEYHTLVLDSPAYQYQLSIDRFEAVQENETMYMQIEEVSQIEKGNRKS